MSYERLGTEYDLMPATVTIDCADAMGLARWWADLLGVGIHHEGEGFIAIQRQEGSGVYLAFQEVPELKAGKNRVHIDFAVRDLERATERIAAAGGSLVEDFDYGEFHWRVMTDPVGNEFCIVLTT